MKIRIVHIVAMFVAAFVGACGYDDRAGASAGASASAGAAGGQAAGGGAGVDTAGGRVTTAPESSLVRPGAGATTGGARP